MAKEKQKQVGIESESAIRKIFSKFDVKNDGVIDFDEVKIIMKSVQLYPSNQKIRDIIAKVDLDKDGVINFKEFLAMRRSEVMCELNVLAQFKKYDVSRLYRGFITPDGIRDVLENEGISDDAINEYIQEFMALDTNGDGKVSFLDLYESMMTRVPDEWLEWIDTNIQRGVNDETLLRILTENGFNKDIATKLIKKTRAEGRQVVERTFVDVGKGYIHAIQA